jgi:hypothetical protein
LNEKTPVILAGVFSFQLLSEIFMDLSLEDRRPTEGNKSDSPMILNCGRHPVFHKVHQSEAGPSAVSGAGAAENNRAAVSKGNLISVITRSPFLYDWV